MRKSEDSLVAWIASRRSDPNRADTIGIGDDMAMVRVGSEKVLLTADMLMDGVHFDTSIHEPGRIGRKAMAVGLSDCAAMAVRPRYAVVSVGLPDSWSIQQAKDLFVGMEGMAAAYHCEIVGGDTNSWSKPLALDVTLVATPYPDVEPVRRDGVRPGDELFVTGRLGGSLRGRHMTFEPRVEEAHRLASMLGNSLHAMMDLSDGLSTDAGRMASASGCGLVFETPSLEHVISDAAKQSATEDRRTPLAHALHDGEDFELLFAVETGVMRTSEQRDSDHLVSRTFIGTAVAEPGVWLRSSDGAQTAIEPGGWQHFT
ncbi:MAG: thiamine-phosphate kinase [Phycisphaerales bacterium]|nr:thiamine-phosphate kinase [Phycisphaerales bacterium]